METPAKGEAKPNLEVAPGPRWRAIVRILLVAALALAVLALLGWWDERRHPERRYLTLDLARVPDGDVLHVDLRRHGVYRFRYGLFLVRDGETVLAFSAESSHLGHQVVWDEKRRVFFAPAHGATWDRMGRVLSGPAPRDLDWFRVVRRGSAILVDLGTVHRGATRARR